MPSVRKVNEVKRDCGVSQRAKENDHELHELNE